MLAGITAQSFRQFCLLTLQAALRLLGQSVRIGFSLCDRTQYEPARLAHDIAGHRAELEVYRLQQSPKAVDHTIAILLQLTSPSRQIA